MGVFDSIKKAAQASGLVEFDQSQQQAPAPQPKSAGVVSGGFTPPPPSFGLPIPTPNTVVPDGEIVAALNQAAEKSQKPGYSQFKIIFDTMQGLPDMQRYPMALKLVEASHKLTPDAVIGSLEDRLTLVENEAKNFQDAWQQEYKQTVESGQQQIQKLAEAVEKKKQEIRDIEQQRIDLTTSTGAAQVKLETERATFNISAEIVRTALTSEKQKLTAYLVPQTK